MFTKFFPEAVLEEKDLAGLRLTPAELQELLIGAKTVIDAQVQLRAVKGYAPILTQR